VTQGRTQEFKESLFHLRGILTQIVPEDTRRKQRINRLGFAQKLIFGSCRIDLVRPGGNSSLEIIELPEARFLKDSEGFSTSATNFAMQNDIIRTIQLTQSRWQFAQRN
jgi:hypothetical protein